MELFKLSRAGLSRNPQAVTISVAAINGLNGTLTVHAGDLVLRIERSEVARLAGAAGISSDIQTDLRSLAASLASR